MEQLMLKKKRCLKHWISFVSLLFLFTYRLNGQMQSSAEGFINEYLYEERLDSINSYFNNLSIIQKEQLILSIHNYLLNKQNFTCDNIIYLGDGKLKYNWKMEIQDNWADWRLKKQLVYILLNGLFEGEIKKCNNLYFVKDVDVLFVKYRGKAKNVHPLGKQSYSCEERLIEKLYNKKVLRSIVSHYKKVIKLVYDQGLDNILKNEKYKLPDNVILLSVER